GEPDAEQPAPPADGGTVDGGARAELDQALRQAQQAIEAGEAALAEGDFAAYGEAQDRLRQALAAALAAAPRRDTEASGGRRTGGDTDGCPRPSVVRRVCHFLRRTGGSLLVTSATVCSNAFSAAGDAASDVTPAVPAARLRHPSGAELVVALRGAAVLAWRAPWRGADGTVRVEDLVDGYTDEVEVATHDAARSARMAPFVNRLAGGAYTFDGVRHEVAPVLPWEPVTMHGFARTLD